MNWLIDAMKSPEALMGIVGLLAGLVGLSVRGVKAKFADEVDEKLDKRFKDHELIQVARDEVVDTKIAGMQENLRDVKASVDEVRTDVRDINGKLDKIMSNGFLRRP